MTAFMMTSEDEDRLREAVALVRAHPTPWDKLKNSIPERQDTGRLTLKDRRGSPIQRQIEHVDLPMGWRVAISCEEQPAGVVLHISVSSPVKGRVPNKWTMELILSACGYKTEDVVQGWLEEYEPGRDAVNVLIMLARREGGRG